MTNSSWFITSREFSSSAELAEATAGEILSLVAETGDRPTAVMLSGGNTPLAAYQKVAEAKARAPHTLHVFFSDERMVPSDSPDSNYRNALPTIDSLGIPAANVHVVQAELPLTGAADAYDRELERFLGNDGNILLGLLGLGADGHTASLFSPGDLKRGQKRLAIPVPREKGPARVSVTPKLLSRVERLLFLAVGPEKCEIVRTLIEDPLSIPAGLAVANHPNVRIWFAR